jgi:prevent-host-death family protein
MMAMKTVTASEANRQFSAVLRSVAQGERITVTSRGVPVATIEPVRRQRKPARPGAAKRRLLDRLATVTPKGSRRWTRDELYD